MVSAGDIGGQNRYICKSSVLVWQSSQGVVIDIGFAGTLTQRSVNRHDMIDISVLLEAHGTDLYAQAIDLSLVPHFRTHEESRLGSIVLVVIFD